MNDPTFPVIATAATAGAVLATVARLLPETIDITFIPTVGALGAGLGLIYALATGTDRTFMARRFASVLTLLAVVLYCLALAGWA